MTPYSLFALVLTPESAYAKSLKDIVDGTIVPIGDMIITLLYALAFLFFLFGMVKFFFSPTEEARVNGKKFAFWGIIGFAVLFATWGLVNVLLAVLTDLAT